MKKHLHTVNILFVLFITALNCYAQEVPPVSVFNTEDYGGGNQNWSISQATNKYIYIANNKGLLEYNGGKWSLYPTPNGTIMRSVKCIKNQIFTGFFRDFGFWEKDEYGFLEFTSIVAQKGIKMFEDEQIWEIIELDGWVLFKSLQRIHLYNLKNKTLKTFEGTGVLTKISKVNGVVYFQDLEKGLFKIENGKPLLVSEDLILKRFTLKEIFYKNEKIFLLTDSKGFYFLENNKLKKWEIPANSYLKNKTIYSAEFLSDGTIALGTISNGVAYITDSGELSSQLNQNLGLSNNTILSVFEDFDKNIWLGLDNGINLVNYASPLKIFINQKDFLGTIYTSVIYDGFLYLGTNQGLFYKKQNSKQPFTLIKKTQGQVWSLKVIDGTLFCGHSAGTFIIKDRKAALIFDGQGTWDFVSVNANLIIQGNYDGLYVLEKEKNRWRLRNKIKGFKNSARFFIVLDNKEIFVNHEYKGVYKLKIDDYFMNVLKTEKDTSVQKGIHSSILKHKNDVFYASKKGVFKYDFDESFFKLDTVYSSLIPEDVFVSGKLILDEYANKLWSFTSKGLRFLNPGKLSDRATLEMIPIKKSLFKGPSGFENIIHLENKKYLIGTINGYLIVDLNKIVAPDNLEISITQILNNELNKPSKNIHLNRNSTFKHTENSLEFYYSVPNFDNTSNIMYQYKLEGYNKNWSDYSDSNSILFENLPFGMYTFKVRALVAGSLTNNISEFEFNIEKPWFLSNIAVIVYILIFFCLIYTWYVLSKSYYSRKQEKFLFRAQKELELKELENEQQLMQFKNLDLQKDIDSKNRELGLSTMNLIKRNELLSAIKKELGSTKDINDIDGVIKLINNNLNTSNDWKLFEEAFKNTDKGFMKKLKSEYSNLTSNDLRLCTYLRLNLSSKEIAPLLNISPRSVEVKRYRLRKKMNLPHEASLSNYILDI